MVAKTPCPLERAKASSRVDISAGLMAAKDHFNLSTHPGWSFQASTWVATTPRPRPSGFWGRPSLSPWRKATHRICGGKVPNYHVSLAPATSEVDLLPGTATARLMHPTRASEEVEGFGIIPDFFQGYLRYLGEIEGEEESCGAGQGPTVGGHYQVIPFYAESLVLGHQWNRVCRLRVSGSWARTRHRSATTSIISSRSPKYRLATASFTKGHTRSTGWSSGE
jgi:hypothetical protein